MFTNLRLQLIRDMYYPRVHIDSTTAIMSHPLLHTRRCKSTSSLSSTRHLSFSGTRRQSFNMFDDHDNNTPSISGCKVRYTRRKRSIKRNKTETPTLDNNKNKDSKENVVFTTNITPSLNSVLSQIKNSNNLSNKASVDLLAKSENTGSTSPHLKPTDSGILLKRKLSDETHNCSIHADSEFNFRESLKLDTLSDAEDLSFSRDEDISNLSIATMEIHPLTEEMTPDRMNSHNEDNSTDIGKIIDDILAPKLKIINIDDLDLNDHWKVDELSEVLPPIFHRSYGYVKPVSSLERITDNDSISISHRVQENGRRNSLDLSFTGMKPTQGQMTVKTSPYSAASNIIYGKDSVELESWPEANFAPSSKSNKLTRDNMEKPSNQQHDLVPLLLSDKRVRANSLNGNFLKLYSIKTSATYKSLIPEVNVDESVLQQLSYKDIWNLDIHETDVAPKDIKIALITKKKLWSDLLHQTRRDLYGEHTPWNMKFVVQDTDPVANIDNSTEERRVSLVRLKSEVKPWTTNEDLSSELSGTRMLKPCGKLKLTSKGPNKEIQYVVKGWCDSRFQ